MILRDIHWMVRKFQQVSAPARLPNIVAAVPPAGSIVNADKLLNKPVMAIAAPNGGMPPFVSMPASMAQLTDRISNSPTILEDSVNEVSKDDSNQV